MLAFASAMIVEAASAGTHYLDQAHPGASDQGPGTEDHPWQTLAYACQVAGTGDTVYIKEGVYLEHLDPRNDGVTFSAFGDDRVVLTVPETVTRIESTWSVAPDRDSVYVSDRPIPGGGQDRFLRIDGVVSAAVWPFRTLEDTEKFRKQNVRRWTMDDSGKLYVSLLGDDPNGRLIELVKRGSGRVWIEKNNCRVRGLVLDGLPVYLMGHGNVVEDCLIRNVGDHWQRGCSVGPGNAIRRCTFDHCGKCISEGLFEENLVVGAIRTVPGIDNPERAFLSRHGRTEPDDWDAGLSGRGIARHNVIAESAAWGVWIDCSATGSTYYGNSFWRNAKGGFYNEANCNDTRILYNAFVENRGFGVAMRQCTRVLVEYNLIDGNTRYGVGIWNLRPWPTPPGHIIRHNVIKGSPAVFQWEVLPKGQDREITYYNALTNMYDHNLFSLPKGGIFCTPDIPTLAEFEKVMGVKTANRQDDKATMADFGGLGTVTFRIPYAEDQKTPVPMVASLISNGVHQDPMGTSNMGIPLFWDIGDATELPGIAPDAARSPIWDWDRGGRNFNYDDTMGAPVPGKPLSRNQMFWLETTWPDPKQVPPEGRGWWSRTLPTVPGARINVSLSVSGKDLEPVDGQAVVAFVRFCSSTGQNVTREFVIGGDNKEPVLKGTFPWQTLTKEIVAPPDARRFNLFFGARPCKGTVRFAQFAIDTLPG